MGMSGARVGIIVGTHPLVVEPARKPKPFLDWLLIPLVRLVWGSRQFTRCFLPVIAHGLTKRFSREQP